MTQKDFGVSNDAVKCRVWAVITQGIGRTDEHAG